ncbi:MAG: AbrB/MazE/SpoVT family DNA-binding domain-containing protein [bacterium]|nr:AbrB/MazE/SpoVT family DNA-binding domain-containing protein [bacterium]
MGSKVVKSTSRGQITLPKTWRTRFNTDSYIVQMSDDMLVIKPLDIQSAEAEEVIFDADRDNGGDGISVKDMLSILRKK